VRKLANNHRAPVIGKYMPGWWSNVGPLRCPTK